MKEDENHGIREFLNDYPGMSRGPYSPYETVLTGLFSFSVKQKNNEPISDSFELKLVVPKAFPKALPKVYEIGSRIPHGKKHKFHVNSDNSFCLGSPLRLLQLISRKPTLNGFAELCLVPYLYAVSLKLIQGGDFKLGELKHGEAGIIIDYLDLFDLKSREQVVQALTLLGLRKRIANKQPCPCGCSFRLGVCSFHYTLNRYRHITYRSWFKVHTKNLGAGM